MKDEQKVFIRGVKGRGDEVLKMLEERGGKNPGGGGNKPTCIYFIWHNGMISSASIESEIAKIIMDNYTELHLPEKWKDGTVLFSPWHRSFAVCKENEDTLWGDVMVHLSLSDNEIRYNCRILKRDYRIANEQERKIFLEWLHKFGKDWDDQKKRLVDWKWKPKDGDTVYYFDEIGQILSDKYDDFSNGALSDFGNCFRTREDANLMAEKIKKLLKGE